MLAEKKNINLLEEEESVPLPDGRNKPESSIENEMLNIELNVEAIPIIPKIIVQVKVLTLDIYI